MIKEPQLFQISNIALIGDDKVILTLSPETPFVYQAGQYVEIMFDGKEARPYSIANAPNSQGTIDIHVRDNAHGGASSYAHHSAKIGEKTLVRGPFGECVYNKSVSGDMVLIAGGMGITPFKAMIEQALYNSHIGKITLIWGAKAQQDLYLSTFFQDLKRNHQMFNYLEVVCDDIPLSNVYTRDDYHAEKYYISGPSVMVKSVALQLKQMGVSANSIHSDMVGVVLSVFEGD